MPEARVAPKQMATILFDSELEAGFAMTACRANPDCASFSSLSPRYSFTCCLPETSSDASVRAPLAFERGTSALHRTYRATIFLPSLALLEFYCGEGNNEAPSRTVRYL